MPQTAAVDESIGAAFLKNTAYTGPATVYVSLHTADPGGTGTSEITTGVSTMARQLATFTGAAGVENPNATLTWSGFAATSVITHLGFWTAQTAGTFLLGYPLVTGYKVFTAVTAAALFISPIHGYTAGTAVKFFAAPQQGVALPTGVTSGTQYFVIAAGLTADAFAVSTTSGGSSIANLTGSGGGLVATDRSVLINATSDSVQIAAASLTYTQS